MKEPAAPRFPPIRKSVTIEASPESAFHRFTAGLASWWPLASHSVGAKDTETVAMEERVGGRIVERLTGGREAVWGTITCWDPPKRLAFTWHPGRDPSEAQDVEVHFTSDGNRTRVELTHTGFERLGKLARRARRGYPLGWTYVLGLYAERYGPGMLFLRGLTAATLLLLRRRRPVRLDSADSFPRGSPGARSHSGRP